MSPVPRKMKLIRKKPLLNRSKSIGKIEDKCSHSGFETMIRFVVTAKTKDMADTHLKI